MLDRVPTTMIMEEMNPPRETFVLQRGAYDRPGEKVMAAGVPACLPPWRAEIPRNRLGFARWLVDPANPLTARVAVNRYWQMLFGTGLVKTVEDFGSQGEWPTHLELLDWLATEFIRTGWDIKADTQNDRDERHLPPIISIGAGAWAKRPRQSVAGPGSQGTAFG